MNEEKASYTAVKSEGQANDKEASNTKTSYDYIMYTDLSLIAAALFVQSLPQEQREAIITAEDANEKALFVALDTSKLLVTGGRVALLVPATARSLGDLKTAARNNRFLRAVIFAQQQISDSMAAASEQRKMRRNNT